jgi:hypothetical protein
MENQYKVPEKMVTIIKGTKANYLFCQGSKLVYEVETEKYKYEFTIDQTDTKDIGDATFNKTEKAVHLMRYINKAIKNQTLKWISK